MKQTKEQYRQVNQSKIFSFLLSFANIIALSISHNKHTNKYNYQQHQDVKFVLKKDSNFS